MGQRRRPPAGQNAKPNLAVQFSGPNQADAPCRAHPKKTGALRRPSNTTDCQLDQNACLMVACSRRGLSPARMVASLLPSELLVKKLYEAFWSLLIFA